MRTKTLEQNTAQDFAGLQINVLQKLRTGNMTYEQFDWFSNISYEKREKLMGKTIKIIGQNGICLKIETNATLSEYQIIGNEKYVRCEVEDSNFKLCWSQAIIIGQ
jgi:hypothetical protein